MKTIHVHASKCYNVMIGSDLLADLGSLLSTVCKKAGRAAIISDSNVWPLYGNIVSKSLADSGYQVMHYVFPAGEASKNAETYLHILNFLAENKVTRSDLLIALGGGVVGDMTGFAAATYLRGVSYVQVPTTLLAMVDSSVGGKTAINLPAGKNLVGAFNQPHHVLCDINTLNSLPENVFRDGCAEVIKYGVIYDKKLFAHLAEKGPDFDREAVIARCVELKRDVVSQDEFDTGARQMLNYGHTIGHGIEAQSCFTITHGQAVAIGMAIVAKSACPAIYDELTQVLTKFGLPTTTTFTAEQLYTSALSDKKRAGGSVNLIIPTAIGSCNIVPTDVSKLKLFIEEGL